MTNPLPPYSKAVGASLGAAIATIIIFTLREVGVDLPPAVAGAVNVLVTTLVVYFAPANQELYQDDEIDLPWRDMDDPAA